MEKTATFGLEQTATVIIYRDFDGWYRWRLRTGEGATVASSVRGHQDKSGCAREMEQRNLEVGATLIRDATVRGFEKQSLSLWLASQEA